MKQIEEFIANSKLDKEFILVDDESNDEIKEYINENFPSLIDIFEAIGGKSFEDGAFRVHTFNSSATWTNLIQNYFPDFKDAIYCFGYDWSGCMFCYSLEEEPIVYMFDPADLEINEINTNIADFFKTDLIKFKKDTLQLSKFDSALKFLKKTNLDIEKCIGYKESLFLGGEDEIKNFDEWDIEVYWETQYNIYEKIKDLPEGTPVGNINFED